jgi:hypothetical protein
MKRTIGFISDTHIFSRYALFHPDGFTTAEGMQFIPSEGQLKIWSYYEEFMKMCKEFDVDTIFGVGDIVHGQNPIEMGTMLASPNMDEQADMAIKILEPLVTTDRLANRKLFMISGSGYHKGGRGHNIEKVICNRLIERNNLNGEWLGSVANAQFDPSERTFNIAHGESAAYIYREMLMGREALFQKAAEALGKIPHIDVIVRGHWHQFIYIHAHGQHMLQLPCWVAFEPNKIFLKSYDKMQPDLGDAIVFLDDKDRIRVWHSPEHEVPHIADFVRKL